jgi:hypothetical protein
MTEAALADWLDSYGHAWRTKDPDAAASLWAPDGIYCWGPFVEPIRGRDAIREAWARATSQQAEIDFGYELFGLTPKGGIARWWCALQLLSRGHLLRHEGIFLVNLDADSLCTSFQEWWVEDPPPDGPTDRLYSS